MNILELLKGIWMDIRYRQDYQNKHAINPDETIGRNDAYGYSLDKIGDLILTLENQKEDKNGK